MINKNYDMMINEWIDKNKERIIESWIELCRIPSIKGPAEEGAPFGRSCADALEFAAKLFDILRTEE